MKLSEHPINTLYLRTKVRSELTGNTGIIGDIGFVSGEFWITIFWDHGGRSVHPQYHFENVVIDE